MDSRQIQYLASLLGVGFTPSGDSVMLNCPNAPYTDGHKSDQDKNKSFGIQIVRPGNKSLCNCFACGIKGSVESVFGRLHVQGVVTQDVLEYVQGCEVQDLAAILAARNYKPPTSQKKTFNVERFVAFAKGNRYGDDYFRSRGVMDTEIARYELGYDQRYKRVVFPVRDRYGHVAGAAGRTVLPEGRPKYYKYPSNPKAFLGEHFVDPSRQEVVLVEGPFDWIFTRRCFDNVIALQGLRLTTGQLESLLDLGNVFTLLLDGDGAGQRQGEALATRLAARTRVFIAKLPEGRDPAELSPEELKVVYQSKEVFWARNFGVR